MTLFFLYSLASRLSNSLALLTLYRSCFLLESFFISGVQPLQSQMDDSVEEEGDGANIQVSFRFSESSSFRPCSPFPSNSSCERLVRLPLLLFS